MFLLSLFAFLFSQCLEKLCFMNVTNISKGIIRKDHNHQTQPSKDTNKPHLDHHPYSPSSFVLTVPSRFLCFRSSLFVRRWFHIRRLFCLNLLCDCGIPWVSLFIYSRLSLSRIPRDSLKHFEISAPRHIRVERVRKTINWTTTFNKWIFNLTPEVRNIYI